MINIAITYVAVNTILGLKAEAVLSGYSLTARSSSISLVNVEKKNRTIAAIMLTGAIMTTRAPNKTIAYILNPINARVGIRLLAALIDLYRATGDVAPGSVLFIIFRLMSKVMVATERIIPIPHQVSVASMVVFPFSVLCVWCLLSAWTFYSMPYSYLNVQNIT